MEEVSNAPELRFSQFSDDWIRTHLSELLDFKNGINAEKEKYGSGYKFINVLDIIDNSFITHNVIKGSVQISEDEFKKNIVEYGDILFQRSSETRLEVGQANVYLDRDSPATFGGFVIRGKKKSNYEPFFVNTVLKTSKPRKEITSRSGGSTRFNIGQETLRTISILIPSLPEQKKIADFLSTVDERIDILTRKKELIQQYKKGMLQQLFPRKGETTPKLRFKADRPNGGADDGSAFPEWEEKRLGELSQLTSSKRVYQSDYVSKGIPFYRGKEISELQKNFQPKDILYISEDKYQLFKENYGVPVENDILITSVGTLGNVWRIPDKRAFYFKDGNLIWLKKIGCNSSFLVHFFEINHNRLLRSAIGSSQKALTIVGLSKIKINLPTPPEQKKIADFLSTIDEQIETVTAQVEHMKTWKRGLLQKMFV